MLDCMAEAILSVAEIPKAKLMYSLLSLSGMSRHSSCFILSPVLCVISVSESGYSNESVVIAHDFNVCFPDDIRCGVHKTFNIHF